MGYGHVIEDELKWTRNLGRVKTNKQNKQNKTQQTQTRTNTNKEHK